MEVKHAIKPLAWSFKDIVWYRAALLIFLHIQLPYALYVYLCDTTWRLHIWSKNKIQ